MSFGSGPIAPYRSPPALLTAADVMLTFEERFPTVYDNLVAPLFDDARRLDRDPALVQTVRDAARRLAERGEDLELQGKRSPSEEAEYQDLRAARRLLTALVK
jgi:hypothetical protein